MHVHSAGAGEKRANNFTFTHCKKHNKLSVHAHTHTHTHAAHTHYQPRIKESGKENYKLRKKCVLGADWIE